MIKCISSLYRVSYQKRILKFWSLLTFFTYLNKIVHFFIFECMYRALNGNHFKNITDGLVLRGFLHLSTL